MTVKIINKSVEICSFIIFPRCFKVKIYLIFAEISTEQISIVLIIPKLSRRIAVTTQVGLSYSPMHNFPRCNQRE